MVRTVIVLVGIALLAVLALLALVWGTQERIVFQPPAGSWDSPTGVRRLDFESDDGTPLFAYLVGDPAAITGDSTPLVIHFHGNAEIAAWAIPWAEELSRRGGVAVLVAEYRGYAGIPGSPGYVVSGQDARALWQVAQRELGATADRTTIHGFSLGSAIATELAHIVRPRALVLEAPFTSARAMAARMGPIFRGPLWRLIARVHYDTRQHVSTLDVPVWVAHGDADGVIPFGMGEEVFAAARKKGEFLRAAGVGHNDLRMARGYWEWLARAIGHQHSRSAA